MRSELSHWRLLQLVTNYQGAGRPMQAFVCTGHCGLGKGAGKAGQHDGRIREPDAWAVEGAIGPGLSLHFRAFPPWNRLPALLRCPDTVPDDAHQRHHPANSWWHSVMCCSVTERWYPYPFLASLLWDMCFKSLFFKVKGTWIRLCTWFRQMYFSGTFLPPNVPWEYIWRNQVHGRFQLPLQ